MKTILVRALLMTSLAATLGATGCYADDPSPQYAGGEEDGGDLVEVSPGVEVIADYDEPIFFADDFYWVNRGGIWYSSTWYGGGWGRAEHVPGHISGIQHPEVYTHYRPAGFEGHARINGGYQSHVQYHQTHVSNGGVHVRAAVHGGGGGGRHR